ncbi:Tripeptidyl-peptidase SED2 [Lecanosticta acicola]|uniref:tripeptidyl-peptidase II n=1 Tax=Lecanosticta acicola TaxID=111012 RepID=A0AAI8Z7E6_9PEZI|nr:Tripeptidyl-peptidase SED2 [Lecanosticta acicola]
MGRPNIANRPKDIVVLAFCSFTLSFASAPGYLIKDSHPVPSTWRTVARAPDEQLVRLQFGLRTANWEALERRLHQVSSPDQSTYGCHASKEEVRALMQPDEDSMRLVQHWLMEHDIHAFGSSPMGDWLTADVNVAKAEALLNTHYYLFQHELDDKATLGTKQWSLPMHLHDHIDAVHPTNAFLRGSTRQEKRTKRSEVAPLGLGEHGIPSFDELVQIDKTEHGHMDVPDVMVLPSNAQPDEACNWVATSSVCLRSMYGTLGYETRAPQDTSIGLVNYLEQTNNRSDIELFLRRYRPDAQGGTANITTRVIAGGNVDQSPITDEVYRANGPLGLEGNLNAETILGISSPIPLTAYNVGGRGGFEKTQFSVQNRNEPYLEWLQDVLAQPDSALPRVISTSYADEEQSIPYWYAKRVCQGFAALGLRGVSVLFASGDEGVGMDGKCCSSKNASQAMFLPTFPASCPYVTAVGGTRGWNPEIVGFDARSTFVSGGGFSNYFPQPSYQRDAVNSYVDSLGAMYEGLYNRSGRAYPDISARSYHYITVWNGTARLIDGTSAASPAAAAIFALVNDALVAEGKPALGWLNPWLYATGHAGFTDVTAGSNSGCNTAGFPAKTGWDAATGFGTPWFPALKDLALGSAYRAARPWYMQS